MLYILCMKFFLPLAFAFYSQVFPILSDPKNLSDLVFKVAYFT